MTMTATTFDEMRKGCWDRDERVRTSPSTTPTGRSRSPPSLPSPARRSARARSRSSASPASRRTTTGWSRSGASLRRAPAAAHPSNSTATTATTPRHGTTRGVPSGGSDASQLQSLSAAVQAGQHVPTRPCTPRTARRGRRRPSPSSRCRRSRCSWCPNGSVIDDGTHTYFCSASGGHEQCVTESASSTNPSRRSPLFSPTTLLNEFHAAQAAAAATPPATAWPSRAPLRRPRRQVPELHRHHPDGEVLRHQLGHPGLRPVHGRHLRADELLVVPRRVGLLPARRGHGGHHPRNVYLRPVPERGLPPGAIPSARAPGRTRPARPGDGVRARAGATGARGARGRCRRARRPTWPASRRGACRAPRCSRCRPGTGCPRW